MTREEAFEYARRIRNKTKDASIIVLDGECIDAILSNPWHKASEELPPINAEVVCKMKGVPHTEYFVCKWDGKFWWHWNDCGRGIKGWFGMDREWEVIEWKEI